MVIESAVTPGVLPSSLFAPDPGPHGQGASPNVGPAGTASVGGVVVAASVEAVVALVSSTEPVAGVLSAEAGVDPSDAGVVSADAVVDGAVVVAAAVVVGAAVVSDDLRSEPQLAAINETANTNTDAEREPTTRMRSP